MKGLFGRIFFQRQVAQLPPEQVEQEEPPPPGERPPLRTAKVDIMRFVRRLRQRGQEGFLL
jgi:hypothetical protein